MNATEVMRAWVARDEPPPHPSVGVVNDSLYIDGWWPVAVHIEPATFLVRADEDGPDPTVRLQFAEVLREDGFRPIAGEWPVLESITLQRLGWLGAQWEVWARHEAEAQNAVSEAARGEGTISVQ